MNTNSCLSLNALELELFLGWPNEERIRKQVVKLDVKIHYPTAPKAGASDDLQDTVCYRELIEALRKKIGEKHYRLIEHVTEEVYTFLKSFLPAQSFLSVSLTKHPQIQGLGSVTYQYRDEE